LIESIFHVLIAQKDMILGMNSILWVGVRQGLFEHAFDFAALEVSIRSWNSRDQI